MYALLPSIKEQFGDPYATTRRGSVFLLFFLAHGSAHIFQVKKSPAVALLHWENSSVNNAYQPQKVTENMHVTIVLSILSSLNDTRNYADDRLTPNVHMAIIKIFLFLNVS